MLRYLLANTHDTTYLLAVPSAMQGADYVIATGRPVLHIGGFMGQDRVVTADSLAQMVADGELRFVYWGGPGGGAGLGNRPDISAWVTAYCTPVSGFDTVTRSAGPPDGTGSRGGNAGSPGGLGDTRVSLYDCGK